ncbi:MULTISPECIES: PepSY domain-containing protein [unclassified Lysobacter]|uniref:PepSY domain-containing protein n=1 Tax=unclassified Lysobacter TaxID=2635362 RepID=UPI0006FFBF10|nr:MULTISPECIES: PepSY domain-containing protein [unclassified Lysobacter]KRA20824.1 hypothetical protein ASD69_05840 [Lysobacter sp. Root604]KRD79859.1 hypothetical protein ASE43_02880 [Lysobacter sp. Root983]
MKPAFWARRAHKWIALVVGVQALLWMISGLYMTSISIDIIHGDHLAHTRAQPLSAASAFLSPDQLRARYPQLSEFRLKRFMQREVYELRQGERLSLVDAISGDPISPLDEATASALAVSLYQGKAPIASVELLHEAPSEVKTRPVPMWRVAFADDNETALYLSPQTGELLAKRHDLWRWFDFLWMFHIMDYQERSDVNNNLLRIASGLGLVFALSGVWLLLYSFSRRRPA